TAYEYQISVNCSNGQTTSFTNSKLFSTTAACAIPSGLTLTAWTSTTGATKWNAINGVINFDLQYKAVNASTWTQVNAISGTTYLLTNLSPSTSYEFQVKSNCSSGSSVFSNSKVFTTSSTCAIPTGLTLTSWADNYGATKWTAVAGATSYDVQYKAASSSTWIQVPALTTNAYWIASLSPATQYEFQVRTNCGANTTAYSTSKFFTTSALCASTYDNSSNNASTGAAAIPLLTPIKGSIANASDVDYYKFGITNSLNLYISLSTLPADYDLTVFNASMVQVASSNTTGTTSEYILLTSPAVGTYYVKVNGVAGANSNTQCYTLKVNNNGSYLKPIEEESMETEAKINPVVYPNPTNGDLNIQFTTKETSNYSVRVMDLAGKQIYSSGEQTASMSEQTHTLRLGEYSIAEGVYIVVTTINEQRYFQRVVYRK
ncbi:MAG TPA: fibronectin type III domain-containing protein, partial [Chitinophagaceae bacterium]|nr:fibronectin type III domain-containing protein [Chitinophagaceae bacterium]